MVELNGIQGSDLLEQLSRALGQVRAEYEDDEDLYERFATPLYFKQLVGITPSFLVGGRGTGKTTTLRSMSFGGQAKVHTSTQPSSWAVVGAYWKVEPNVVSVFRGRGLDDGLWSRVFAHYLNLKLCSLVVDFGLWLERNSHQVSIDYHRLILFSRSLGIASCESLREIAAEIDLGMVDIEFKINGNISGLRESDLSMPGKPLDYLFSAIDGLQVDRSRPFMFCLDEYENFVPYQQRLLNTLIKQVGGAPYTFKIGVRNTVAIERETLVEAQPLQDPADFTTVDIVSDLKGESFEKFAATVVGQRLDLVDRSMPDLTDLLPSMTVEEEAELLGAGRVRDEFIRELAAHAPPLTSDELAFANELSNFQACMVFKWAKSHEETLSAVLRFAMSNPRKWEVRVGNYGYAMLFAIRENRVGERKYYTGWRTYSQLADGNIRYMIRLVYEALRRHVIEGGNLHTPVSMLDQTRAAARVGETTIRDLQSWSRQGAALTRLALGLGSIFGSLAREVPLSTPEVSQFRVNYTGSDVAGKEVDALLIEAIGQGILLGFEGDKNARNSGATREEDYQLHPVLSPYFVYSARRKRRMMVRADDLVALTQRDRAAATVRGILNARGSGSSQSSSVQLDLLEQP